MGESHLCKTMTGPVPSITNIYSLVQIYRSHLQSLYFFRGTWGKRSLTAPVDMELPRDEEEELVEEQEEPVEEEEEPYEGMVSIVEPEEEDHRWASSGLLWIPIASSSFSSQKNSSLSR